MSTFFRRLYYILTLRCDDSSHLMSDSLDRELVLYERMALRGHLLVCRFCSEKKQHFETIHHASSSEKSDCSPSQPMPVDVKQRMRERISQEL